MGFEVHVKIDEDMVEAFIDAVADSGECRSKFICDIVEEWLTENGYLEDDSWEEYWGN